MAGIGLEDVSRIFPGDVWALRDVNLGVVNRELLVLLGASGSGKTTLLRLIAGLDAPTRGQIRIGSQIVNDVPAKERNVGMVFQQPALMPQLTVAENLTFGLRLRGRTLQPGESVLQVANDLDIGGLLSRRPGELSGGQRQRVALGRAVMGQPSVLLLDEPLSNLDAPLRLEMRDLVARLHQRLETTTVYVTHDQSEAMALGARIAVMRAGAIQQIGSPQEVYEFPSNRYVAEFLGSPPMNLVWGELRREGDEWRFERGKGWVRLAVGRLEAGTQAGPTWLGIRPEHLRIVSLSEPAGNVMRVRVVGVEWLGPVSVVTAAWESAAQPENGPAKHQSDVGYVKIRIDSQRVPRVGEDVTCSIDSEQAHVFDAVTGASRTRK